MNAGPKPATFPPPCNPLPTLGELERFLQDYDLGRLNAFHPGNRGRRGRVITDRGSFWLVGPGMADAFLEDLLEHLHSQDLPVPSVVRGRDGRWIRSLGGHPGALVRWPEGRHLDSFTVDDCIRTGELLGRIHRCGLSYIQGREPRRDHRWRRQTAETLAAALPACDQTLLREEIRFQGLYRFGDLPQGIIHGAPNRQRLVFDARGRAGITGFGHACRHALLVDVAVVVNDCCTDPDGRLDHALSTALLNAYHTERPLTAIERGAWPALLRLAALDAWLEALTLVRDQDRTRHRLVMRISEESTLRRHWIG